MDLNLKFFGKRDHESLDSGIFDSIFDGKMYFGKGKQEEESGKKQKQQEEEDRVWVRRFSLTDSDRVFLDDRYKFDPHEFEEKKSVELPDNNSWVPPPTIQTQIGGNYESWYNPDVPFFSGSDVPTELVKYCNAALEHYNKTRLTCEYVYLRMLKACTTHISSFCIVDMIFTAKKIPSFPPHVETFEARVRAGFRCDPKVRGYAVVVEKVGQHLDLKCWSAGHVPRECIYEYGGIRCPKRPELLKICESILACLNRQGKKYKFLDLLCAYYKKLGPTRYFDVRLKVGKISLDGVADIEIFEAQLYFVEKTPNGHWFGGGGRFLGISHGQGSRFVDHI